MDVDFHFGTVYVLSRWAGFGSQSARIIAASSQFVDDNIDNIDGNKASSRDTGFDIRPGGQIIRYSGHEVWDNIWSKDGNEEIWIPYHFLPGLEGDNEEEKLVCKKHSKLAKELQDRLKKINYRDDSDYCFKLGIGLHVFADTWAHQEFSGVPSVTNVVKDLAIELMNRDNWTNLDNLIEMTKNMVLDIAAPLGHAAAIHWPDKPYAKWRSSKFPAGRDNCVEFLEAAEECYNILAVVSGDRPVELSEREKSILRHAFLEIRDDDAEERNRVWERWISQNAFGFSDYDDGDYTVAYSKGLIIDDADYSLQFYRSIDEYYHWCQGRLEENGITCVGYFEGGDKII